ncbi:glycosyltransferase family 4 protein [Flavicella sediminum]|uniref:glycosyltransferase family 4 protein n=1 Tax=Flavicella sediminum TaxID=2585141 RepID=UPI001AA02837|nr:glycosyltransferase family 4 protein [Flavicella sediminum]
MAKGNLQTILIIGYVWPEPNSSAAGSRMLQLIELFLAQNWSVTFSTPAQESGHRYPIEELGVQVCPIKLNCDSFDTFIEDLQPTMVLFDRFMMEEQFGWRVSKFAPNALKVLETVDLHTLRKTRELCLKNNTVFELSQLNSDLAKREVASIFRCDISILISAYEMELLQDHFKVPKDILCYLPFMLDPISEEQILALPSFEERQHFVTIGNFIHAPNLDCVRYIKQEIWPILKTKLPKAEMHVYGSYPQQKALQLHNPKERFFIKGWADDANEVVSKARVCLAPLRFGAGMKGKLIEAMYNGTPSVTTDIGAESMHANLPWNGLIKNTVPEIVDAAIQLYTDKELWLQSQKNGMAIVNQVFPKERLGEEFLALIEKVSSNLEKHRQLNFIGAMLLHHTMKSTEFMSKWIAEKNKSPLSNS